MTFDAHDAIKQLDQHADEQQTFSTQIVPALIQARHRLAGTDNVRKFQADAAAAVIDLGPTTFAHQVCSTAIAYAQMYAEATGRDLAEVIAEGPKLT